MDEEEWSEIFWFEDYLVSNMGRVRNKRTNRFISPFKTNKTPHGTVAVKLFRDGDPVVQSLRNLVANAFLPRPQRSDGDAPWDTVVLRDGDPWNVRVDNMAWRPRWFSMRYARNMNQQHMGYMTMPVVCLDTGVFYESVLAAAIDKCELPQDIFNSAGEREQYVYPSGHQYAFY